MLSKRHLLSTTLFGAALLGGSFTIGKDATVTGIDFTAWDYPTSATIATVDWAIFSGLRAPYAPSGSVIASGTATVTSTYILTNLAGYAVNTDTFDIAPTALASGTYSIFLANAADADGDSQGGWDVNGGSSTALVRTNFGPFQFDAASNTFQVLGNVTGVPEPQSWALMVVGIGLLGTTLRRSRPAVVAA
jgi:hypothetical protein